MDEILNIIHKTIYQFFDACEDDEEVPMSEKDKLLLEVNKAICNNLKVLNVPVTNAGDLISRQAVLDLAKRGRLVSNGSYKSVCDAINGLPSVETERKTGHWIMIDEELQRYKCSECGEIIRVYNNETLKDYKFSHCWAKMEVDV